MKFGVVIFPGSNCDHDTHHVLKPALGQETVFLWPQDTDLQDVDTVILPGGFAYGDYLRCGAIAKFSPILESVRRHAQDGKLVVGICNGFQILQEAGLLPGVMLRNAGLRFVCRHVWLRTENNQTPFTNACQEGQVLKIPIAHNEGNFFISKQELAELQANQQIIFRYSDAQGDVIPEANPNGSIDSIAGVMNRQGNVMGMMPHPERASEALLSSEDGRFIFKSMINRVHSVSR
ncbi:MAG: phosphoribosylformylglycinamidine synthase subunit PurQ [Acidobacteria bacterium]|nr:MAG: phosphoribosylformylglycinamidine synthase subunit PurQ [Acidobacteriota bacterium]